MKKTISLIVLFIIILTIMSQVTFATNVIEENNGTENVEITYQSHIQNIGWQGWKKEGELAGTTGQGLRMEALQINLKNLDEASIEYKAHVQNIGWQNWKKNGETTGTTGQGLRMEAICIKINNLDNYNIYYRAHVQNIGWQNWKKNGEIAGTTGQGLRIEALEIKLVKKGEETSIILPTVTYQSHVQNIGWQDWTSDGKTEGTTGQGLRMEALKINLENAGNASLTYQAHVQNVGWQNWKNTGEITGTTGQGLRMEAIRIKLNNQQNYSIQYRVHVQNIGWQGWKKDGELAGTTGQGLRIEAIEIKIVYSASTNTQKETTLKGIDVSHHNGEIDWNKVKNSGIDFAIIRLGYGENITSQDDRMFARNVSECERLNIPYGVYFYSYATNVTEAVSEADHAIRLLKNKKPTVGVWFDMEDADGYKSKRNVSDATCVQICDKFCSIIKNKGYKVGIYASYYWFEYKLNSSVLDKYDKWVAQWGNKCTYKQPYTLWQYSSKGNVPGIEGYVDLDYWYKK